MADRQILLCVLLEVFTFFITLSLPTLHKRTHNIVVTPLVPSVRRLMVGFR